MASRRIKLGVIKVMLIGVKSGILFVLQQCTHFEVGVNLLANS